MALNKEDKSDVKNAMGKALANKVSKVTRDKKKSSFVSSVMGEMHKGATGGEIRSPHSWSNKVASDKYPPGSKAATAAAYRDRIAREKK